MSSMRLRGGLPAALILLASLPACGYRLAGDIRLPPHIKVIAVLPFENRTTRPEIEQRVTEEVARELNNRSKVRVGTDASQANAILEGAVTSYRTIPVQFTEAGRQNRAEAIVTLRATLRDSSDDSVLWSQSGLVFKEQFDVAETGEFFDQESLALDDIARGAASVLVTSMVEGF